MKVSKKVGRRSRKHTSSVSRRRLRNKKTKSGYKKKHAKTQKGGKRGARSRKYGHKRGRRFHKGGVTDAFLDSLPKPKQINKIKVNYAIIKTAADFANKVKPYFYVKENTNNDPLDGGIVTNYRLYTYDAEGLKGLVSGPPNEMNHASPVITLMCKKEGKSEQSQKFSCYITYSRSGTDNKLRVMVIFTREDNANINFSFYDTPDAVVKMLTDLTDPANPATITSSKKEQYSFNFPGENKDMFDAIVTAIEKYKDEAELVLTMHDREFVDFSRSKRAELAPFDKKDHDSYKALADANADARNRAHGFYPAPVHDPAEYNPYQLRPGDLHLRNPHFE